MDEKMNKNRKKQILAVVLVMAVLAVIVFATLAWFFHQRSLKTAASLISPYTLRIGAGSNESIEQLDMGNIDVSTAPGHKDYVICVYGNPSVPYVMQLAHTTNIGFRYEVYYAGSPSDTGTASDTTAEYIDAKDKPHYFPIVDGNMVRGGTPGDSTILMNSKNYINYENGIADDSLKVKQTAGDEVTQGSYNENDKVQKNASALYMQSATIYPTDKEDNNGDFIHYYIVRVSWGEGIKNDKETDIVYITVSAK